MEPLDPARGQLRHDLFGGHGAVRVWSLSGAVPPFTAVLWCELEGGGRVGLHRQETDPEVVIVVAGRAAVEAAGVRRELGPGGSVGLPLGALLAIENLEPATPVQYLIVKARGP